MHHTSPLPALPITPERLQSSQRTGVHAKWATLSVPELPREHHGLDADKARGVNGADMRALE